MPRWVWQCAEAQRRLEWWASAIVVVSSSEIDTDLTEVPHMFAALLSQLRAWRHTVEPVRQLHEVLLATVASIRAAGSHRRAGTRRRTRSSKFWMTTGLPWFLVWSTLSVS